MTNNRRTTSNGRGRRQRRVVVRGIRRSSIDVHKLSRALIALMQAKAEAEAQAAHEGNDPDRDSGQKDGS